jgi:decaprenylphospho-beta-D-erythro-pentofuranosid-2-ulose 2-reductase
VKVVSLGATSGMGRALARLLAERGESLFLLGLPPDDLERSAKDLELRGAEGSVGTAPCNLLEPGGFEAALAAADAALGGFDTVIVSAGLFASQEALEDNTELCGKLLAANYTNTVMLCEAARKRMLARGGGTLCVFSSVAGERGRKPVILYGSAKAGLTRYLEGLDHKFRAQGLVTVTVKPGFVRTSMTEGLKPPPFAGEPEDVARLVLRALDRGTPVVYAPPIWSLVMFVIRRLPRFVMRRIGF